MGLIGVYTSALADNSIRSQHYTTSQLTKVIDHLVNSTNREERTAAVFLDFEKAFDKVWHDRLLEKLLLLHVSPSLVRLVQSFLYNRTYSVPVSYTFLAPRTPISGWTGPGIMIYHQFYS